GPGRDYADQATVHYLYFCQTVVRQQDGHPHVKMLHVHHSQDRTAPPYQRQGSCRGLSTFFVSFYKGGQAFQCQAACLSTSDQTSGYAIRLDPVSDQRRSLWHCLQKRILRLFRSFLNVSMDQSTA